MPEPDWLTQARAEGRILSDVGLRPGGSVSTRTEGVQPDSEEWEQEVTAIAQARGWAVAHFRKVRVARLDGTTYWQTPVAADGKGMPDLQMFRGTRQIAVECKTGTGRLTPEQKAWLDRFRAAGVPAYVWYPKDRQQAEEVLK